MKFIEKKEAPVEYEKYCKSKNASYNDLKSVKNKEVYRALKVSLLEEQGYICCYCGCRISINDMTIEHLKPRCKYKKEELNYSNLLASCCGEKQNKKDFLHCNFSKANKEISINPLMQNCEGTFAFDEKGTIYSIKGNNAAESTIQILNLNNPNLRNRRKAAFCAYDFEMNDIFWKEELKKLMNGLKKENGCKEFEEFCFATVYYIKIYKMNKGV